MFTWICPTCGRECPPSYTECPDCSARQKGTLAVPAPVPPASIATPPPSPPPPERPAPPPLSPEAITGPADLYRPPPPPNLPAWAVTLGVALLMMLLVGGLYYFLAARREDGAATAAAPAFETPGPSTASSHPYAKHLELAGFRIVEDARRRPQIRYVIINHSSAELASVPVRVTFTTANAHPDAAPVATVNVKTPRLGAYESQEMISTINTNLRAYELPDWQFLRATVEVTGE
jgi:hypothetical protein